MARIKPKITPNFRTECDGFLPHFSIQMGSQGKLKKVINFGAHRYVGANFDKGEGKQTKPLEVGTAFFFT